MTIKEIRSFFVKMVYADHNRSRSVVRSINRCISELPQDGVGLNLGAGSINFDSRIRNLDIFPGENIYYVAKAESIPEKDDFFDLIITQEVLEHVQDPFMAMSEISRTLKPNGTLYCQLPFIIGYHPGPTDYWRFTKEGIEEIIRKNGFKVEEIGISVGGATGFYRISVEFFSVLLAVIIPPLCHAFKALFAVLLFPIKWLDIVINISSQKDRIPGGYYVIAKKLEQ